MDAKTLGAEPASYVPDEIDHERGFYKYGSDGLTKREMLAAMAMQGVLANAAIRKMDGLLAEREAKFATEFADALLAELAKGAA